VLQCVVMCCSALQCVAVCCSVLQRVAVRAVIPVSLETQILMCQSMLQCVLRRCSVCCVVAVCVASLQCVLRRCSVCCVVAVCVASKHVAVCVRTVKPVRHEPQVLIYRSILQCIVGCCSMLQSEQQHLSSTNHKY